MTGAAAVSLMQVAFMTRFIIIGVHAFELRCTDVCRRLIDVLRGRHRREQQAQADESGEHQSECRMEMFQHNKTGGLHLRSGRWSRFEPAPVHVSCLP